MEKIVAIEASVDTIAEDKNKQNEEDDLYKTIAVYAAEVGGIKDDLNEDLQEASLRHLAEQNKESWQTEATFI